MVTESHQKDVEFITVVVGVSVSLIGSIFIVIVYLCYKDLHTLTFRLIFYMSLADILNSLSYLLPSEGAFCYMQAVGNTIFALSTIFWTSVIAYCLHRVVIKEDYDLLRYERYYLMYAYGLPLVFMIPPAATQTFGYAQGWCWITADGDTYIVGSVLRLVCFYLPLWTVIGFNTVIYVKIIRQLNLEIEFMTEDSRIRKSLARRLLFYPIILIVVYLTVTIKRIYDAINPSEDNISLLIVSRMFQTSHGLLNAIAYGYSDSVKERLCGNCYKRGQFAGDYLDDSIDTARRMSLSLTTSS